MQRAFFKPAVRDTIREDNELLAGWLMKVRFNDCAIAQVIIHRHHSDPGGCWTASDPVTGIRLCGYHELRTEAVNAITFKLAKLPGVEYRRQLQSMASKEAEQPGPPLAAGPSHNTSDGKHAFHLPGRSG